MTKKILKPEKSQVQLAEAIAAVVNIVDIRLIDTSARLNLVNDKLPLQAGVGRSSRTERDDDSESIVVKTAFEFDAKDPNDATGSKVNIRATFQLRYKVVGLKTFDDDQVKAFGAVNGCYNAWPFWREYVYSTLARMGLPAITLPVFRFDQVEDEAEETTKEENDEVKN